MEKSFLKANIVKILKLIVVITFAIYIFIDFTFDILNISFEKRDITFDIIFEHATSVQIGTQLEMSGFEIGEVIDLKLLKKSSKKKGAIITVAVNKKYQNVITNKADFFIAKRKFIGLTFIQIIPKLEGKSVKKGDVLYGISPPRYNLLGKRIDEILKYSKKFLVKSNFIGLLNEVSVLSKNIKEIKEKHKKRFNLIKKDTIRLIVNLKILYNVYNKNKDINIDNLINRSEKLIKIAQENTPLLLDKSEEMSNQLLTIKDEIMPIINKGKREYKPLLKKIKSMIEKLNLILEKTEKITSTIENVGNIALFLNDKEINDYSKAIFRIIKQEGYRYIDTNPLY